MHFIFLLLLVVLPLSNGTLYPVKKGKDVKQQFQPKKGPQDQSVRELGFISKEPLALDILINNGAYHKDTEIKIFNGTVLGYVTPWNSHGYDVAKVFAKKFNIISPVWLQIIKNQNDDYEITGTHDIDAGWMRDIRQKGKSMQVIPRIMFDKMNGHDYSKLLTHQSERKKVFNQVINTCLKHKFDGVVLEFWSQLSGRVDDEYLITFVKEMGQALKGDELHLVLVIPPHRETSNLFTSKHLDKLYTDVYAFSLMTYDYSSVQRPGANAPLKWVRHAVEFIAPSNTKDITIKRQKILMGLNMYGNDFTPDGGGPIVGGQYLDLLKNVLKKRLSYDETDVENYFEVRTTSGRHYVFYPTLHSINERIKLANELGVGLSIWELGQGLDYFYDLF